MATKKISALTELTTPAGTEELIVNAGGTSKKIQIDNLSSSLADNSVTLAKMAGGTDGNLITYDASGDPAYVTTGTSGQVLTSGGTGVAPTFQTAAGGKVLQVVQGTSTTNVTTTSSTWTDIGLSASITPATGSKVLIMSSVQARSLTASDGFCALRMLRDSTSLYTPTNSYEIGSASSMPRGRENDNFLDASPGGDGSTAITYKIQASTYLSAEFRYQAGGEFRSTITLMEIGA